MNKKLPSSLFTSKSILLLTFFMIVFLGNAQTMKVSILGGAQITNGGTLTINAGNSVTFQITNTLTQGCGDLRIQSVSITDKVNFSLSNTNPTNVKPDGCNGDNYLNFTVTAIGTTCGPSQTFVNITSNTGTFHFTFSVVKSPIISVLGGNPLTDIMDNNGTNIPTSATKGTYFGVVESGLTQTRRYMAVNTGSCTLNISAITSSLTNFTIAPVAGSISPGEVFFFDVTFFAPVTAGTYLSTITVINNTTGTTNPYTFNVSAEVFNFNIPGPGGVTADFRLWLKATRGVNPAATNSKVSEWKDLGANPKNATQPIQANQPTYLDDVASNINFNPVVKFENTGATEQYLYNETNGFYSQDLFIVMMPNTPIGPFSSTSSRNTIFAGVSKKVIDDFTFAANDITGIGYGNYTTRFTNEVLSYNQNIETNPNYNGYAEISTIKSYANAGIINVRNDATVVTKQEILYNSKLLSTSLFNDVSFTNVGYVNGGLYQGTPYWIGRNYGIQGSLNGRIAEIMTFAQRVPDADRPKIETYLAIKYGITLGDTQAEKNYINSAGIVIWDHTEPGFNFNVAGIGRDVASDLNQKQSKSINEANEVTIGLGEIAATNSANINEFLATLNYLVWGCNGGTFNANGSNIVTINSGLTSTITKIDRKWKIKETGGDVQNIYIGIPESAFSGFLKAADEEYVLIVSDDASFGDINIIDVIPLKIKKDAMGNTVLDKEDQPSYQTWYDFDGPNPKYFTFGKAPKLSGKRAVNIAAGDCLVGERLLDLNYNSFTVSVWIRNDNTSSATRNIMAKGEKMQMRLNSANRVEVVLDDHFTASISTNIALNDKKWHQITFVYASGSIFLYVDGILDSSKQNINPPTPNFNPFSVGALYITKNDIRNPFLGEIDEVYIWNRVLTQNQIRYLMNQEIEKFTGNLVTGKVLPQTSPCNEVTNIPWSDLKAFHDFNSFYGTTVEGLTDDRNFLRIKYLDKTKTITDPQTAPLPYVSAVADGVWGNAATWINGAVQNPPNSLGLDGSTTVDWNIVETSHNITSGARNIEVLGLKINSGKIIVDGTLDLVTGTGTGHGLRVSHYLKLDGEINLAGESQLVQAEGCILDEKSGGFLDKDQQGTASSYNYNYWSSSVGPITTVGVATGIASPNLPFSVKGNLLDANAGAINFQPAHYAADLVINTPPNLIVSSYWLYKFYGKDDDYNSWFPRINENSPLEPGEGYTMKGTSKSAEITDNQNYKFRGKPYNGTITLNLKRNDSKFAVPLVNVNRLVGNPYPSAIDANEFILDNIKQTIIPGGEAGRNSVNVFNGALYFWHHFSGATHYLAEYVGGYATYTLVGGVQAYSTDSRINNSTPLVGGGKIPERYIPVNQGFFVITALPSGITGTTTTVEGGEIIFKNRQRVFIKEGDAGIADGSLFFKGSKKTNAKQMRETRDEKAKIRLQFTSPKGYVRQLLVGIAENATDHFDIGYDAPMADVNKDDIFWIFDNAKFVIQAVDNFDSDQELPLGIIIAKAGLATIKIDELENMDEDISLHIKDKLTNEVHNISKKDFQINLDAGQYLDRFSLIFKMQKIVAEDISTEILLAAELQPVIEGIHVFMDNKIGELQIKNNSVEEILSVALYNYLGQRVNHWNTNLNRRIISLPINPATGVYIVQINTKTGQTVKKISVE